MRNRPFSFCSGIRSESGNWMEFFGSWSTVPSGREEAVMSSRKNHAERSGRSYCTRIAHGMAEGSRTAAEENESA